MNAKGLKMSPLSLLRIQQDRQPRLDTSSHVPLGSISFLRVDSTFMKMAQEAIGTAKDRLGKFPGKI
jgi:hypothetical protein